MTRPTLSATLGPLRVGQTRPFGPLGHTSAIDKQAVTGPIYLDTLGLAGDQQADRRVHGGPDKALHYFPAEHYATLAVHWPALSWAVGAFGENLSGHGLSEADVCVGDVFSLVGKVLTEITGTPILLFFLAAGLIPVGISLFKRLKSGAK